MTSPLDTSTVAALIGSRICHDLVSPIGAIANGLELLELSGVPRSPELALVAQSVTHANARIRLFRLAFGQSSDGQVTRAEEVTAILRDLYAESRIRCAGFPAGSFSRSQVRLVLLALLCAEQAIPQGGAITLAQDGDGWRVRASGPRLATEGPHWVALCDGAPVTPGTPALVHFLLLPLFAAESNMNCAAQISDSHVEIRISPA